MMADREAPAGRPSKSLLGVGALSLRELEAMVVRGETPDPDGLAGFEFRGLNALAYTRVLGIKKFFKGFYKDEQGALWGYNMPARQSSIEAPWQLKHREPHRFGFFRVDRVEPTARDNAYLHALLLDYDRGGNWRFDQANRLRDYVVRVDRGSDDLLLGKAYVALGPVRVPVGFFVLERHAPTEFRRTTR